MSCLIEPEFIEDKATAEKPGSDSCLASVRAAFVGVTSCLTSGVLSAAGI